MGERYDNVRFFGLVAAFLMLGVAFAAVALVCWVISLIV